MGWCGVVPVCSEQGHFIIINIYYILLYINLYNKYRYNSYVCRRETLVLKFCFSMFIFLPLIPILNHLFLKLNDLNYGLKQNIP